MPLPFYFAWVDPGTAFNPAIHNVHDEDIISFDVDQIEGDFASLNIAIRNPNIGLLSPARKVWAWLSWFNGTVVTPLGLFRLVAIPSDIQDTVISLLMIARPLDYLAQKAALAETLKVAPFYDPIWIAESKRDDPNTVLEARSELWHFDRVTHVVTTSNILVGEDGNVEFQEGDVPRDSVKVRMGTQALTVVTVDGVVNWDQAAKGVIPINTGVIYETYTGDGLLSAWPKSGGGVGGGWSVAVGSAVDVDGIGGINDDKYAELGGSENAGPIPGSFGVPASWLFVKTLDWSMLTARQVEGVIVPLWRIRTDLSLAYETSRDRTEHVKFALYANVQPISTLDDEPVHISISSSNVGEPIAGVKPIGDVRRRSYFPTVRGLQSLEYLIALARATLLDSSRAVEISFECRFETAVTLSCRKNVLLHDPRLPGHQALGKIIKYGFKCDGDSGVMIGRVTIGCAIGYGGSVAVVPGDPVWVDESWVAPGWQQYTNQLAVLGPGDVGYTIPVDGPNDDGLNLLGGLQRANMVTSMEVINPASAQRAQLVSRITAPTPTGIEIAKNVLKEFPTRVIINLKAVEGGPFETVYNINVSELEIPKMIDLEAAT